MVLYYSMTREQKIEAIKLLPMTEKEKEYIEKKAKNLKITEKRKAKNIIEKREYKKKSIIWPRKFYSEYEWEKCVLTTFLSRYYDKGMTLEQAIQPSNRRMQHYKDNVTGKGVTYDVYVKRLYNGWSDKDALSVSHQWVWWSRSAKKKYSTTSWEQKRSELNKQYYKDIWGMVI